MSISEYWEKFLKDTNQNPDEVGFSGELSFDGNSVSGPERLTLVLNDKKTAVFTAFDSYGINREQLPVSGELYIVEDASGKPACIIEVTDVNLIPFGEISWGIASREGEDETLEEWREKTRELMEEEGDICGFEFNDSSKLVCEIFRVIYR